MPTTTTPLHAILPTCKTGRYLVATEHSEYLIDLDAGTLLRWPVGAGAAHLRGDNTSVTLLGILRCEVGEEAVFALTGLAERGETVRRTTRVLRIEVA